MPLHHQKAHDRNILVDYHPGLHLVWYYDLIFVKPMPAYFYSRAFWEWIKDAEPDVYRASLGFMRSFYHLIQYELDFDLAVDKKIIPKRPATAAGQEAQVPTYEDFCAFMAPFRDVVDAEVCERYSFGELRLTRIDKTVLFFKGKLAYFHIYPQWGSFLTHILAPVITVFAVCSVVLNSMQVTLAGIQQQQQTPDGSASQWDPFVQVSMYFPVTVMILIALVIGGFLVAILLMTFKDFFWVSGVRKEKRNGDMNAGEKSHGVIW
jgi:hypothetical protein